VRKKWQVTLEPCKQVLYTVVAHAICISDWTHIYPTLYQEDMNKNCHLRPVQSSLSIFCRKFSLKSQVDCQSIPVAVGAQVPLLDHPGSTQSCPLLGAPNI
jgi:hypothetical protein